MRNTGKHGNEVQDALVDELRIVQLALEQISRNVFEQIRAIEKEADRARFLAFTQRTLEDARSTLLTGPNSIARVLPLSRLKASEVVSQGLVNLSQASLYRAAENGRFYSVKPNGRSIGAEFPTWQFTSPVPELIAVILAELVGHPSREIHAFWVTALDELNELSPAEMLAGLPFESRKEVLKIQQRLMDLPTSLRQEKIKSLVALYLKGVEEIVG